MAGAETAKPDKSSPAGRVRHRRWFGVGDVNESDGDVVTVDGTWILTEGVLTLVDDALVEGEAALAARELVTLSAMESMIADMEGEAAKLLREADQATDARSVRSAPDEGLRFAIARAPDVLFQGAALRRALADGGPMAVRIALNAMAFVGAYARMSCLFSFEDVIGVGISVQEGAKAGGKARRGKFATDTNEIVDYVAAGHSYGEAAKKFGLSREAVKKRVVRRKKRG